MDNTVNPDTSTVSMRVVFPNPNKTLLPGIYGQARLHMGTMPDALLVPQQALAEDQAGPYVMVVKYTGDVEHRRVKQGDTSDGMRIILEGVKEGEKVIIGGLQLVRPGVKVRTKTAPEGDGSLRGVIHRAVGG